MTASDAYWHRKIGDRSLIVGGQALNPRAQALIALTDSLTVPQKYWTPKLVRGAFDKSVELFDGAVTPVARVVDIDMDLAGRTIRARQYSHDTTKEKRPCIIYYHGGGFVIGGIESYDKFCRKLAVQCQCDVLSIDYRLAPEDKYPAALEDAVDSWKWLQLHHNDLEIDPANMSIAGDSAGAGLALVVSAEASHNPDVNIPVAMGLIYPPLASEVKTNSRKLLGGEKIVLTNELLDWFKDHFLPDGTDYSHPGFGFMQAAEKGRMPPTWILTCGFDPLRDDGYEIAEILGNLDAEVSLQEYKDLYHGFITMSGVFPQVGIMIDDLAGFFKRRFQRSGDQKEIAAE
ncbi:alpha/beta hydrolase [Sneathiella marina]|uniref:Alpha/beta hydrolase n=1 Tax=Sneathiella marina TaxID=2950108 RepID=A0ABY4W144_9PROT|nr:alpha/beta hydrolase [Sneathiella marina]USG60891.1 alpha/beta hydrolase [Sneathiella marina]